MKKIMIFGDSNTWGYNPNEVHPVSGANLRYPKDVRWTWILKSELGDDYEIISMGYCGRTMVFEDPVAAGRSGLAGLEISFRSVEPVDMVIIMLGTNDLKDVFAANGIILGSAMNRLVRELKNIMAYSTCPDAKIMIVNPANVRPCADGSFVYGFSDASVEHGRELREQYASVAEQYGCEFFDGDAVEGITLDPADGVHLTPADHRLFGMAIAEKIREIME